MSTRSRTAAQPSGADDPRGTRRPARRGAPTPVVAAGVVAVTAVALAATGGLLLHGTALIDLAVYRTGGRLLLAGEPLYAEPFPDVLPGRSLPFTYPPFAALCFTLLAALPSAVVAAGWTVAGLAALVVALRVVGGELGGELGGRVGWPAAVLLGCLAVVTEPVWQTLLLGQVNLLLLAAVVVDALALRGRRGQGALIGLAAAVKLTPAVFVLFLLAGRQWRAAATAVAVAVGATVLAALVIPSDSRTYWFSALRDPSRIGDLTYAGNQSVRGVLARLGLPGTTGTVLWAAAGLAVLGAGWWAARRLRTRGEDLAALLAVAVAGLLVSPVSWSHHWVWLLVAVALLVDRAARTGSRAAAALAALTAAVALVPVHRFLPKGADRELAWSPVQQLGGSAVALLGLVLLGWLVHLAYRTGPVAAARGAPPGPG